MFTKILTKLGYTKEETSWVLYDIGNSAQVLTTMTVLFPLLIASITPGDSTVYVGWANAAYALILAFLSPILGTIADYKGKKKRFFKFFLYLGIITGFLLAMPFFDWRACVILYVLAMIGYTGANIFYDAFLVDVTTDERTHTVSAAGYAWGYIGSVLPFIVFIIPFALVTLFGGELGYIMIGGFKLTNRLAITISMVCAVAWWFAYSRPIIRNVHQIHYHEEVPHVVRESFKRLFATFKNLSKNRNVFLFCLAYFFYIDAVNTVISMAISLATDMGIDQIVSLGVVIFINIIACPGSIIFGRLATRFGGKKMILTAIMGYLVIVLVGSQLSKNANLIWVVGFLVGMFQGGLQAVSRSYYALLIPEKDDANEYFGFFEIFSKFAAIIGPVIISVLTMVTGKPEIAILGLIPLMVLGTIFLLMVKDHEVKA